MTNQQLVDFLGPVAARHDLAVDRYVREPSPENEALVRLYAADLCRTCFHGSSYDAHIYALYTILGVVS